MPLIRAMQADLQTGQGPIACLDVEGSSAPSDSPCVATDLLRPIAHKEVHLGAGFHHRWEFTGPPGGHEGPTTLWNGHLRGMADFVGRLDYLGNMTKKSPSPKKAAAAKKAQGGKKA
jgi:hypothetical protein